jgi:hypothetical protein
MPDPTNAELAALLARNAAIFQRAIDTIVEAFQAAQIDPEQAAKIQEIAAALKAIRDRPRR